MYGHKLEAGLSPRSAEIVHATLHKVLKQAVAWTLIPRNVAEAATPPCPVGTEIKPLSREQVRSLLEAAKDDRLHAFYVLAVTTGMRNGELLGLQWKDVDLEDHTLRVHRTVFNGVVSPPKTATWQQDDTPDRVGGGCAEGASAEPGEATHLGVGVSIPSGDAPSVQLALRRRFSARLCSVRLSLAPRAERRRLRWFLLVRSVPIHLLPALVRVPSRAQVFRSSGRSDHLISTLGRSFCNTYQA